MPRLEKRRRGEVVLTAAVAIAAMPGLEKRGRRRGEVLLLLLPLPDLRRGGEEGEEGEKVLLLLLCPDSRRGGRREREKVAAAAAVPGV